VKIRRKKSRLCPGEERQENTSGCFPLQEGIRKPNNSISQLGRQIQEKKTDQAIMGEMVSFTTLASIVQRFILSTTTPKIVTPAQPEAGN